MGHGGGCGGGGGASKQSLENAEARAVNAERVSADAIARARRVAASWQEAETAKKNAAAEAEAAKKIAADAAKDMAALQQETDTAYKLLSRFNLLHEVVANATSGTTAVEENIAPLQEAIQTGDTEASKMFVDLRGLSAPPLQEVRLAWRDPGRPERKVVVVSGMKGLDGFVSPMNGTYVEVLGDSFRGKPVFLQEDRDGLIVYGSATNSATEKWLVTSSENLGTRKSWMRSMSANSEATQFPWEETGGWEVSDGTSFHVCPSASVTQGVSGSGTPLHYASVVGTAGMCSVLLDLCPALYACVDAAGRTAREIAAQKGHLAVVREIDAWREKDQALQQRVGDSRQAEADLRQAARDNTIRALQDKLHQNINPFAQCEQTPQGNTALHLAATEGHTVAVFHILTSAAARTHTFWTLRNNNGKTAWELANFFGHSEVCEEIDRQMLQQTTRLQHTQAELATQVQHKVELCQEECARLEAALATVETMTAEYARTCDTASSGNILNVDNYRELVQTVLARDIDASQGTSGDSVLRFNSDVKSLVCGEFADAANGLIELLQVEEFDLSDKIRAGLSAVKSEIELFGNEDLINFFDYVANEPASEVVYSHGTRDKGRIGTCLADFIQHAHAKEAKLSECDIVALRLYTLPPFVYINDPLRDTERVRDKIPHPLPVLTEHLTRALRKLRRIDAAADTATGLFRVHRVISHVLQCVVACCSVLQCVAVCCVSTLQPTQPQVSTKSVASL